MSILPIFDVHVHIQPWQMVRPEVLEMLRHPSLGGTKEILSTPANLLRHLDAEGVDRICCINYVSPEVTGFTPEVNDWILDYTEGHGDRLLAVGSVNPLVQHDVGGELRRILDRGLRMVKIHPPHQLFAANAYRFELPSLGEIYAECEKRGVPVMIHTGTSVFPRARNVYADPMPIDDVAVDFPKLRIILAHAGRPLHGDTAFFLARRHPNVMLDISGIPPKSLPTAVPRLTQISKKVLWGTDWPSPGVISMRSNIDDFLALDYPEEVGLDVLGGNATRLFGAG